MSTQSNAERAACRELQCPHPRCFGHDRPHCPICPHRRYVAGSPPACAGCSANPAAEGDTVCDACRAAGIAAPSLF